VILTLGNSINLLTMPLTVYLQVLGKPRIEVRYGLIAAALNLGLTLAFSWLGLYAIVLATTLGQMFGSVALMHLARASVEREIPSFLRPIPWLAAAAAAITAAAAAFGLRVIAPWHGLPGLVLVSLSWLPATVAFVSVLIGPRCLWLNLLSSAKARSIRPLVDFVG